MGATPTDPRRATDEALERLAARLELLAVAVEQLGRFDKGLECGACEATTLGAERGWTAVYAEDNDGSLAVVVRCPDCATDGD